MKQKLFLVCVIMLVFVCRTFASIDTTQSIHRHRRPGRIIVSAPGKGYYKNLFIVGPEVSVSGDGELFAGAGAHIDWISIRGGQHMGHWRFCDHIFTYHWNWYFDHPHHYGMDAEYDMFRSYSGYGGSHIKLIEGVKISHLYDYSSHEIVWTPLLGFTLLGLVDLKFGYVLPVKKGQDDFYNTNLLQFDLVYRPFLISHPPVL